MKLKPNTKKWNIAIIGATGLVGKTLLTILREERFPIENLFLFASKKSAGLKIKFNKSEIEVKPIEEVTNVNVDFAFFMTAKELSQIYVSKVKARYIIDNSSAFRLNGDVPLIVPEINFNAIKNDDFLIANPNCTTAICSIPIKILHDNYTVESINATTFQAVSGSGKNGLLALKNNNKNEAYPQNILKTCIPKIGEEKEFFYTEEELKILYELRKIIGFYDTRISATCVRVPIKNCHSIALKVKLKKAFILNDIKDKFSQNDQLTVMDDLNKNYYPNAITANGNNKILIGRIREDLTENNSLLCYITADNLRRGASYNAYRIMEYLIKYGRI